MADKIGKLVMVVFVLLSSSAYAQGTFLSKNIKNNVNGAQMLLHHVPKAVALGKYKKTGPTEINKSLNLLVVLPSKDPAGLADLLKALYDPKSPSFHQFLTHNQVARQFGANPVDSAIVVEQLKSYGLVVTGQSDDGCMLKVSGSVANINRAFKVTINNYKGSDGKNYFSPDLNPTLNPQLAGKINTISGLNNIIRAFPHHHLKRSSVAGNLSNASPNPKATVKPAFSAPGGDVAPSDILTAYNLNSVSSTGTGQTLALYELDGYVAGDVTRFINQFGISPVPPISVVPVNGGVSTIGEGIGEVDLDIDLSLAVAPGLSSILVYEDDQNVDPNAWLAEWNQIYTENRAKVISCSWGLDEIDIGTYVHTVFDLMAAQGQTVFAASGDAGAYDNCQGGTLPPSCVSISGDPAALTVNDPASYPYVTGVGISILSVNGSEAYVSETASKYGGGGISAEWPISNANYSFQTTVASQAAAGSKVSTSYRNVPDVVFTSDKTTPFYIYISDPQGGTGWYDVWGSSAASPIWAAFISRVNQGRVAVGQSVIGWLNPAIYQVYTQNKATCASTPSLCDFHDITSGYNCNSGNLVQYPCYPAAAGFDDATGLGSFNGANLYADLAGGPAAPTGLTALAGNTQITLNWSASTGASSYNIYRGTASSAESSTPITNVSSVSYTDLSLSNGITYYYRLKAINAGGQSAYSAEAFATPVAPPPVPTGLGIKPGNTQLSLTWNASATATSYHVKRSTVSGGPYSTSGTSVGPGYTDNSLTNGIPYYYKVSAVNGGGESANSNPEASGTPSGSLPVSPASLTATAANGLVTLSWTTSAGAVSYNIYRGSTVGGENWGARLQNVLASSCGQNNCSYPDNTVLNGISYYYVVSALNGSGEGANTTEANATPLAAPLAPTGLNATPGNMQVALSWSASATAASYNVKRSTVNAGPYTTVSSNGAVTSTNYTDTSLSNGTTYYYVVSAVNVGGESPNSSQVSAVPISPVVSPSGLTALILGARVGGKIVEGGVVLNWTKSTSSGVTKNNIYRSTGSGAYSLLGSIGSVNTFTDQNMPKGVTYHYVVTAVSNGNESAYSNAVSVNY